MTDDKEPIQPPGPHAAIAELLRPFIVVGKPGGGPVDDQRQDSARLRIETFRRGMNVSGNPLNAWAAYLECRSAQLPIPDWILTYFDMVASNLWGLITSPPSRPAVAIAEALNMKKPGQGGRGNVFKDYGDVEGAVIAADVYGHLRRGEKLHFALEYTAKGRKISKATVGRAWRSHSDLFGKTSKWP